MVAADWRADSAARPGPSISSPEIHQHDTFRVELHHGHRSFVDHPEIAIFVEPDGVGVGQPVDAAADFADEVAFFVELQQLRGGFAVDRPGPGATWMIQD